MMWQSILSQWRICTALEKRFFSWAAITGFFIALDFSVVRPVSNAFFISHYGSEYLPWAWLLTVPFSLVVVALYNRYLERVGVLWMFFISISTIAILNGLAALFVVSTSWLSFFLYIYKDVSVLLFLQQLWALIHSVASMKQAKVLYGPLFMGGALGALCGSQLASSCAVFLGSQNLLFISLLIAPVLCLLFYSVVSTYQKLRPFFDQSSSRDEASSSCIVALVRQAKAIFSSKILFFISFSVLMMQLFTAISDYQFDFFLQRQVLSADLRTAYYAKISVFVQIVTLGMQSFGLFLCTHFLGVQNTHRLIPLVVVGNSIALAAFPGLSTSAATFVSLRGFGTLFGLAKEMLYIPLSREAKFHTKAFLDVFIYRFARVLASCLILGVQWMRAEKMLPWMLFLQVGLAAGWFFSMHALKDIEESPRGSIHTG